MNKETSGHDPRFMDKIFVWFLTVMLTCAVGAVAWGIQIEGRVSKVEARVTTIHETLKEVRNDVKVLLQRIPPQDGDRHEH